METSLSPSPFCPSPNSLSFLPLFFFFLRAQPNTGPNLFPSPAGPAFSPFPFLLPPSPFYISSVDLDRRARAAAGAATGAAAAGWSGSAPAGSPAGIFIFSPFLFFLFKFFYPSFFYFGCKRFSLHIFPIYFVKLSLLNFLSSIFFYIS